MGRHIVPDEASIKVPHLSHEDRHALNRLTAYGRSMLEGSSLRCGCFRCGSSFVASEITDWMPEEDGADTALCPYCGCDAVIYETKGHLLSTALLSKLYLDWFSAEFKGREKAVTYVPTFSTYDDYLRQGIPFLMENRESDEIVGEVNLFRVDAPGNATGFMHEDDEAWQAKDLAEDESGGMVEIVIHREGRDFAYKDENIWVNTYFEFIDELGRRLPYELWSPDQEQRVLSLVEKYGSKLRGVILRPSAGTMRIVAKEAADNCM